MDPWAAVKDRSCSLPPLLARSRQGQGPVDGPVRGRLSPEPCALGPCVRGAPEPELCPGVLQMCSRCAPEPELCPGPGPEELCPEVLPMCSRGAPEPELCPGVLQMCSRGAPELELCPGPGLLHACGPGPFHACMVRRYFPSHICEL